MKFIADWLKNLEELKPIPTAEKPRLKKLDDIKAVIFDIYGTLLVSSSGDINQAEISGNNLKRALREADFRFTDPNLEKDDKVVANLLATFVKLIHQHQDQHRESGIPFPEVDIRDVWKDLIDYATKNNILKAGPQSDLIKLTFIFELLSNKVCPMPDMKKTIAYFHDTGYPLGIISNAQFYTPIMMNYFLTEKVEDAETITFFDPDLTVFSYKLLRAKPDTSIFEPMLKNLKLKYNISPEQAVFIGNDLYKDIYTASKSGMKTIFFAGDERSLRLRNDQEEVKGLKPDAVITNLEQLKQII
jgi:putative hydrolase of the HAD superfamily